VNTLKTAPKDLCPLTHTSKADEISALEALLHRATLMAIHLSSREEDPQEGPNECGTVYSILTAYRARDWVHARIEKSFGPLRFADAAESARQEAKRLGKPFEILTPIDGAQPTAPSPQPISYEATRSCAHDRIRALHQKGTSLRKIVQALEEEGVKGPHGGSWHVTSIRRVLANVG
jgi:hypothetical protein